MSRVQTSSAPGNTPAAETLLGLPARIEVKPAQSVQAG
jgi:hypothetical protein